MLKRYLFLCVVMNGLPLFSRFQDYGRADDKREDLKAAALLIKKNVTILGDKNIGKDLNVGSLALGCPAKFAVSSRECNLAHLGAVIGLSARLSLPQAVDSVAATQFFDIPLYIEDAQAFVKRGTGLEVCGVSISQNAQGVRGLNNDDGSYSFAVVEFVVPIAFNPGFGGPPVILLTFEDQRIEGDIFEDCLVRPVPGSLNGDCIMWTNAQFATQVEQSSACIHYLLYFSIAGLDPAETPPEMNESTVRALNEFVRDIINKTAINIQAVGPVAGPKKLENIF